MEERALASFLRELRAMPSWEDTVVVLVSDHGEQFRERGGLYHLHSLYDEEVRIPGFIVGGSRALTAEKRLAVQSYAGHRTYLTDVNATLVDLFGVGEARLSLPFARRDARSFVAPGGFAFETFTLLSTATAVWHEDDPRNGVMFGDCLLVGAPGQPWTCFDMAKDPRQVTPRPAAYCGARMHTAADAFGP